MKREEGTVVGEGRESVRGRECGADGDVHKREVDRSLGQERPSHPKGGEDGEEEGEGEEGAPPPTAERGGDTAANRGSLN